MGEISDFQDLGEGLRGLQGSFRGGEKTDTKVLRRERQDLHVGDGKGTLRARGHVYRGHFRMGRVFLDTVK